MSISCKCSNFVATSSKLQQQQPSRSFDVLAYPAADYRLTTKAGAGAEVPLSTLLSQVFQEKYPRDFLFYPEFTDFFKHAIGPIPDLTVNVINQRELLYGLTLDAVGESWQLSICINCKDVLCAKRLTAGAGAPPTQYLINSTLLNNGEELAQRRGLKSYSETFNLLIMDHTDNSGALSPPPTGTGMVDSSSSLSIGSLAVNPQDTKGQRLRQLLADKQAQLQEEIKKTEERIERYTSTEYELLKSFREKADQDCAQLMHHIRLVPEHVAELLDRGMTPALEVTGNWLNSAPGARRRNTISSRRELSNPTTPTTTLNHPPSFLALNQPLQQQQQQQQQQPSQPTQPQLQPLSSTASAMANARLRKMSNFDTPPATPEATPMSVGNSPTFRQQQQQQSSVATAPHLLTTHGGGVTANGADDADDCLFDLEDVEEYTAPQPVPSSTGYQHNVMYQRVHSIQPLQNGMVDDLDEADTADEAEDALDLDSSISIPAGRGGRPMSAQLMNFARSLPIEMPNSTLAERVAVANNNNNNNFALGCEEGLDNIDIAASIQALTKSVHGEAVFGDLPRPRLRSQIEG